MHTQGNWRHEAGLIRTDDKVIALTIGAGPGSGWGLEWDMSEEERADNARLLAAADKMLDALQNLTSSPITWLLGYKTEVDEAMRQALDAIDKATR